LGSFCVRIVPHLGVIVRWTRLALDAFAGTRILKSMTKVEVEQQAKALSKAEQIDLAYSLLQNATPALSAEQEVEADRRIEAYQKDPSILISEEEALARLKTLVG
jgi:hypothetical protein